MRKKFIIAIIATTMALSLTGCESRLVEDADKETEQTALFVRHRFDNYYSILVDKETGVCYMEMANGNQYGMTVMLNADGTPKIWEEKK